MCTVLLPRVSSQLQLTNTSHIISITHTFIRTYTHSLVRVSHRKLYLGVPWRHVEGVKVQLWQFVISALGRSKGSASHSSRFNPKESLLGSRCILGWVWGLGSKIYFVCYSNRACIYSPYTNQQKRLIKYNLWRTLQILISYMFCHYRGIIFRNYFKSKEFKPNWLIKKCVALIATNKILLFQHTDINLSLVRKQECIPRLSSP